MAVVSADTACGDMIKILSPINMLCNIVCIGVLHDSWLRRAAEEAYGRLFERFENLLPFVAERTAPVFRQFVERGSGSDAVFGIAFVGIVNVSAYGAAVFLHVFHHV